jgi:hypothetical protein
MKLGAGLRLLIGSGCLVLASCWPDLHECSKPEDIKVRAYDLVGLNGDRWMSALPDALRFEGYPEDHYFYREFAADGFARRAQPTQSNLHHDGTETISCQRGRWSLDGPVLTITYEADDLHPASEERFEIYVFVDSMIRAFPIHAGDVCADRERSEIDSETWIETRDLTSRAQEPCPRNFDEQH